MPFKVLVDGLPEGKCGFYAMKRRKNGQEFEIERASQFSHNWMKAIDWDVDDELEKEFKATKTSKKRPMNSREVRAEKQKKIKVLQQQIADLKAGKATLPKAAKKVAPIVLEGETAGQKKKREKAEAKAAKEEEKARKKAANADPI